MAVASSYLADHLRQKGVLSTTATRKIFTAFGRFTWHLLQTGMGSNLYLLLRSSDYTRSVDDGAGLFGQRCCLGGNSLHTGPVRTWSCYCWLLGQRPGHSTQLQWHHFRHGQFAVFVRRFPVHVDGRCTDLQQCKLTEFLA